MAKSSVQFRVNGKPYTINSTSAYLSPESKLVDFIRDDAKLTGTKYLCREGGCGACVVSVSKVNPATKEVQITSINSCLTPVLGCDGWDISTIEALGNKKDGYHPIQKSLAESCGSQCGFCTPGMVMSMHSLMESNDKLTVKDIEDSLDGNICRCTGYRPILDAFKSFATDASPEIKKKSLDNSGCLQCPFSIKSSSLLSTKNGNGSSVVIKFEKSGRKWAKVVSLNELYNFMQKMNQEKLNYKLVAGNTGTGIFKADESNIQVFVDISSLPELHQGSYNYPSGILLGGGLSITEAIRILTAASKFHQDFEYAVQIAKHFSERVGNTHIRNTSTLAGNLALKRQHLGFASDIFLLFEAVAAQITVGCCSSQVNRTYGLTEFLKLDLTDKVIISVLLPPISNDFVLRSFKISPRYQNSKGYINAAFLIPTAKHQNFKVVQQPTILFGGINSKLIHASRTESFLNGKSLLDESALILTFKILDDELQPDEQVLNGTTEYRKSLAKSLLYKTILGIVGERSEMRLKSGGESLTRGIRNGKQSYIKEKEDGTLYQGFPKLEAVIQTSGEAEYTNDIPSPNNLLFGAFVLSTVANTKLKSIDATSALKMDGVVAFIQAKDVPGKNNYMVWDKTPEEIFVSLNVQHAGQPLGLILAESREIAFASVQKVKVEYEDVQKPILTIRESLEKAKKEGKLEECTVSTVKSILDTNSSETSDHVLKGRFSVGSQHHFQMEPHTCLCIPKDDGLTVFSSTQWIDRTQAVIASVLNIPVSNINAQVKRLGGGFGGKAARSSHVAAACAVAAYTVNKPVKIALDLETHMRMHGKRLPWDMTYEVSFDNTGKLTMLNLKAYCDPGFSPNEQTTYLYMMNIQNCYEADGWTVLAGRALTNTPANTFCRAPGHTQGAATIEHIMEHVAFYLKKDPWDVRKVNFMTVGSPFLNSPNSKLEDENPLTKMIEEFKQENDYEKRIAEISNYNQTNRWSKRGLAVMPLRFTNHYIYQKYSVFVAIYHIDGSVAISHGGIEMGQGISTKIAQVVAEKLGIPLSKISVKSTNNLVTANSSLTAAGTTSESCCFAASEACKMLVERMAKVKEQLPEASWTDVVKECHKRSIDLTASFMSECYKDGLKGYDVWSLNMTEVEVDVLTGEYKIRRLDYKTDGTKSLNPAVDLGQIEGALVFGLGLWTTEKIIHDANTGELLTNGTWDYKPPEPKDIPEDFRVTMYQESQPNKNGVLGSKSPGEASLCSSVCVIFALRNAINEARKDAGNTDWYELNGPVTPEDVFKLCLTSDGQLRVNV